MPLHSRDVTKLLNAGFIIIRADEQRLAIKHKSKGQPEWKTLEAGFKSKAEMYRKMNVLLNLSNVIND